MRLIDADNLCRGLCEWQYGAFSEKGYETEYAILESVLDGIQRQPTIDAVPVVRCKDCKHNPKEAWFGCPMSATHKRTDESWCSFAERDDDNGR